MISGPATSGATFFDHSPPSGNKQHKTHPAWSEELAADGMERYEWGGRK